MALRLEYRDVAPEAVKALAGLNAYSAACSIPQCLRRLIEIRVSQVNGCSYCIAMHHRQCLVLGESVERLDDLERWRESTLFMPAERAALAWVESITLISERGAPEAEYTELQDWFTEVQIVDITFVALSMNAWNRLAITFGREAEGAPEERSGTSRKPRQ